MKVTLFLSSLFGIVCGNSLLALINQIGEYEIANISMLTPKILSKYPLIRVVHDNSVIASQYLLDLVGNSNSQSLVDFESQNLLDDLRKHKYIQTNLPTSNSRIVESEWEPMEGCVDNSLSDTVTTITRTSTVNLGDAFGPRVFFKLLGSSATLTLSGSFLHLTAEKLYCDIEPGQTLQIHHKTTSVRMDSLKQRKVELTGFWKNIKFSEWEEIDPENSVFQVAEQIACVTDPDLLRCSLE
ncbi:CIC11C00000000316 [Sungouiella intermedia]|uniref:CIC11C00000000316 n=1 Tax=Sungouiella intermedia TaxID=45354 RepID=A0A1L0BSP7_9ASCO|nr:CIC11C00000000316 [[Candida] intermedia]